jgi:hypothetical protein
VPAEGNSVETALSEIAIRLAAKIVLVIPTIPNPKITAKTIRQIDNQIRKKYWRLSLWIQGFKTIITMCD